MNTTFISNDSPPSYGSPMNKRPLIPHSLRATTAESRMSIGPWGTFFSGDLVPEPYLLANAVEGEA